MTIQTLTLARHAKSSWQSAGLSDHDRSLNKRGKKDAPEMARRLSERSCIPDLILCSSANRAMQTTELLQSVREFAVLEVQIVPELYLASPDTILKILTLVEANTSHAMIVAHNPGLEDLSNLLAGETMSPMPTMGIRSFSCHRLQDLYTQIFSPNLPLPNLESDTHKLTLSSQKPDRPSQSISPNLIFEDYPKNSG